MWQSQSQCAQHTESNITSNVDFIARKLKQMSGWSTATLNTFSRLIIVVFIIIVVVVISILYNLSINRFICFKSISKQWMSSIEFIFAWGNSTKRTHYSDIIERIWNERANTLCSWSECMPFKYASRTRDACATTTINEGNIAIMKKGWIFFSLN